MGSTTDALSFRTHQYRTNRSGEQAIVKDVAAISIINFVVFVVPTMGPPFIRWFRPAHIKS